MKWSIVLILENCFHKNQFQSVTGIWAPQLDDATCIALNHKYKLMAFGRKK